MSSCHVLIMCKLPCIINDDHIFLSFGMYLTSLLLPGQSSCHLCMACQLLQNMASGHIKVKKGLAMYFTWLLPVTLMRVWTICIPVGTVSFFQCSIKIKCQSFFKNVYTILHANRDISVASEPVSCHVI